MSTDAACGRVAHDLVVVERVFPLLAKRRAFGVGLAVVVEVCLVVGLSFAPSAGEIGIPAAVTAAVAGTVAVVFGVLDGVCVALVGALVFASRDGWGVDDVAPLVLWPGIVAAVGVFARRVEYHRARLLREVLTDHERDRKRLAVALQDGTAQELAGALMMLAVATSEETERRPAAGEAAREIINQAIQSLRAAAVDLSPKVLETDGLGAAVEELAATLSRTLGARIDVDARWDERLEADVEVSLFRVVQHVLAGLIGQGERDVHITLDREDDLLFVTIEPAHTDPKTVAPHHLLRERMHLLGGRIHTIPTRPGKLALQLELALPTHQDA